MNLYEYGLNPESTSFAEMLQDYISENVNTQDFVLDIFSKYRDTYSTQNDDEAQFDSLETDFWQEFQDDVSGLCELIEDEELKTAIESESLTHQELYKILSDIEEYLSSRQENDDEYITQAYNSEGLDLFSSDFLLKIKNNDKALQLLVEMIHAEDYTANFEQSVQSLGQLLDNDILKNYSEQNDLDNKLYNDLVRLVDVINRENSYQY